MSVASPVAGFLTSNTRFIATFQMQRGSKASRIVVEPGPSRTDFLGRSISAAKKGMPEYAGTAGVFRTFRANTDGKQVGDPEKAVKLILKVVDLEKTPLHIPLGARAYALARTKVAEFTADLDAWEEI